MVEKRHLNEGKEQDEEMNQDGSHEVSPDKTQGLWKCNSLQDGDEKRGKGTTGGKVQISYSPQRGGWKENKGKLASRARKQRAVGEK